MFLQSLCNVNQASPLTFQKIKKTAKRAFRGLGEFGFWEIVLGFGQPETVYFGGV